MAGKKKRAPGVVFLELQREVIFRRADAIRFESGPNGLAVSFETGGNLEAFSTLDAAAGEALTEHVLAEAGEWNRLETRLPEGVLRFDLLRETNAIVLRRRAEPAAAASTPDPEPVTAAEPEPEPEAQVGLLSPEDMDDSLVITIASEVLVQGVRLGVTRLTLDPSTAPYLTWEGGSAPAPEVAADVAAPLLRRFLVMAGMAYTRKTEGVITMRLPNGEKTPMGVSRRAANDREPIVIELAPATAGVTAASDATESTTSRPYPGTAIGEVRSSVRDDVDGGWGKVESEIVLDARLAAGLKGLEGFSHAIVVFWMERSAFDPADLTRRPRSREDMPLAGIFAQRAKHRPNPIGVTTVKIEAVDPAKGILRVQGLDALNGTPVLDVKPYVPAVDHPEHVRVPDWMDTLVKE